MGLCVALALGGCTQHQPEHKSEAPKPQPIAVKQAPPTPVETKRVELGNGPGWDPGWDTFIERSLPAAMLSSRVPRDVRRFCPRFFEMSATDKRAYWAYFFQALAAAEAGLDPKTNVRHTEPQVAVVDPVTDRMTRSEGLLQLSYYDQKRYGCNFNWKADRRLPEKDARKTILQAENNLACGIKILDTQIIAQHKPLFARTSYWSTLQPGTVSYRIFAKQMTNPPPACGLSELRPRRRTALSAEHATATTVP
ncbi:MAG: hypothetical protein ACR2JE_02825 [Acidobacteriaceae bacterium]